MKAVIASDNQRFVDAASEAMRALGWEPVSFAKAQDFLDAFSPEKFPLLVVSSTDGGLDGLKLCRTIRNNDPRRLAFVLMATDRTSLDDVGRMVDYGADDFLLFSADSAAIAARLRIAAANQVRRAESIRTEDQFRTTVERFELSVRGADDGLWDALVYGKPWQNPDTHVWFSTRSKELLGFRDDEFPNVLESWELRLHPDDRQRVFAALANHIEHKRPYDVEYRLRTKSGEYHWFSARGQAVWDDQGRLHRMAGSLREITQIKEYEAQLEQSEAKWRSLVENAPDIIILTDPQGILKFINRATPEADRAVGRTVYDYVRESHWDIIRQAYEGLRSTGQPQQFELRAHQEGGGTAWYSTRLGPIWRNDKIESVVLIATDISDRKAAESQMQQSEAKWRSLVENAPDLIILTDVDGTIRFINRVSPGFEATVGRTVYEYIDEEYWEIARAAHEAVCRTGQPQQYEVHVHGPGGPAWYAARLGPIWNNGRVESVVRIATDITDRKVAEEQLNRERESLRRLVDLRERERQLVAYDIHDGLVQYLTGGIMHLEAYAATKSGRSSKSKSDYERGVSLLRDALSEARRLISGLRPPILDEQGVAASLEYLINEAKPDIPELEFVNRSYFGRLAAPLEVAMFRITQEALSNIRLHSGAKRARVELLQHGRWARLSIRDWGCGFDLSKIRGERFGLQGIRQRARLLGTVAVIESAPGQGTLIAVDVPLELSEPDGDAAPR